MLHFAGERHKHHEALCKRLQHTHSLTNCVTHVVLRWWVYITSFRAQSNGGVYATRSLWLSIRCDEVLSEPSDPAGTPKCFWRKVGLLLMWGSSVTGWTILYCDYTHHHSDEQMQHNCNSATSWWYQHFILYWLSELQFFNLTCRCVHQPRPADLLNPCIENCLSKGTPTELGHSNYTAAQWSSCGYISNSNVCGYVA